MPDVLAWAALLAVVSHLKTAKALGITIPQ
jgi:hypothetical protein